jgi:hypothetical protein
MLKTWRFYIIYAPEDLSFRELKGGTVITGTLGLGK